MKWIEWMEKSNRWKHLAGGFVIGIIPGGWFAGLYGGILTASALEYKDKSYGGVWDLTDWSLTVGGAAIGCLIRLLI